MRTLKIATGDDEGDLFLRSKSTEAVALFLDGVSFMRRYSLQADSCRASLLLREFGESPDWSSCMNCDVCVSKLTMPDARRDLSAAAALLLFGITAFVGGANAIIDGICCRNANTTLIETRLKAGSPSKIVLKELLPHLVSEGFVTRSPKTQLINSNRSIVYDTYAVTEPGRRIISGDAKIFLHIPSEGKLAQWLDSQTALIHNAAFAGSASSRTRTRNFSKPVSMRNTGNRCFVIILVQAFSHCPSARALLIGQSPPRSFEAPQTESSLDATAVSAFNLAFRHTVATASGALHVSQRTPYSAHRLFSVLPHPFNGPGQHDASEMYIALMNHLAESKGIDIAAHSGRAFARSFSGEFIEEYKCQGGCGHCSIRTQIFNQISVPVTRSGSIDEIIAKLFATEIMSGDEAVECYPCSTGHATVGKQIKHRRISISSYPINLVNFVTSTKK